ncbi:endonuclease MutS2 [Thermus thermamylovorans]|uniref:Endonuclease MutS2 n=1 Tax=Thermus thermamylovorans TaxID=2509362 RepID=A0A4Q9B6T0_9DEIN|nr:Smr/MutS family protein [Thermus thermamylovorans]TBH21171.1 endonuclease MutS2 [Thermus thermamylovorans]
MRDVLEVLEFPRVRALLAGRARTPLGRELALSLAPLSREEAERRHQLTQEALAYPYALPEAGALREAYEGARAGKRLTGPELLKAARALEEAKALKAELLPLQNALSGVAEGIGDHGAFLARVKKALDEEGAVRDEASPRLAQIRRELRPLRQEILDRLYALMDRHREAFQDRFVTLRRERYCVPVKAGMAHKVPGLLLDESESGATLFLEPLAVVKLNNRLQALRLREEEEVNRILWELSEGLAGDPGVPGTLEALALLDLLQAQAALARDLGLTRPRFGERYALEEAFHPLIPNPVKNSFALDEARRILLLSGPNMGGKTALLKTLGLAVLMAQSGLFVGAKRALLAWPDRVFADIGDEQSLQESLSTFAGHLRRLKEMLEEATPRSLVLVDELGSGTDPEEGAALSQAILEALLERGVKGMVTTHLSPLKAFAQGREGIGNASMRFDLEALRPTYELVLGVPGRSYALAIARRLALPEGVLGRAEGLLPEGGRLEALLERLEAERLALEEERRKLGAELERAEALRKRLEAREARYEEERAERMRALEAEVRQRLLQVEAELKALKEKAKAGAKKDALRELLALKERYAKKAAPPPPPPGLSPGQAVEVASLGRQGRILELRGEEALVQVGPVRMTVKAKELRPAQAQEAQRALAPRPRREGREVDLRGLTVEEALLEVDSALEEARALGLASLRLLHGKGTGALRQAIREALRRDRRVEGFADAPPHEGGHGVTVVALKG